MFQCEQCGACCRNVWRNPLGANLASDGGVCRYLDKKTNLCSIYNNRPIYCNIDEYYERYLRLFIDKEEYYKKNKLACRELQKNEKGGREFD